MKPLTLAVCLLGGIALALISPSPFATKAAEKPQLKYVGSSTVGRFMNDASKVYTKATFKIDTKPESGGGENAVASKRADIGGVAREVKPKILKKGVEKYLIGRDAIAVLVHKDNPVGELSKEQLAGIFTGKITNWSEVGGSDMGINVYIVNPQSATRKVFREAVLGKSDYAGKTLKTIRPDADILNRVAGDPGAIGHLSFALLPGAKGVKPIAPFGQEPSVNNPKYPITRPLYLITNGPAKGAADDFIKWAISDEGQKLIKKYYVGLRADKPKPTDKSKSEDQ